MKEIFTIGHSTRTSAEFLSLLEAWGAKELADVRTIPKSRHNPQFNGPRLKSFLRRHGILYRHFDKLGGLRRAAKDSKNSGWRNASFRGFADYMSSADFKKGLRELTGDARRKKTAIMCAEAVPWRCHRSLIADALTVKGWKVRHIASRTSAPVHRRISFLRVRQGELTYPASAAADRF